MSVSRVLVLAVLVVLPAAAAVRPGADAASSAWTPDPHYVYVSTSRDGHRSFLDQESLEHLGVRWRFAQMVVAPDASRSLNRWELDCVARALRLSATVRWTPAGTIVAAFSYEADETRFRPIVAGSIGQHVWDILCRES